MKIIAVCFLVSLCPGISSALGQEVSPTPTAKATSVDNEGSTGAVTIHGPRLPSAMGNISIGLRDFAARHQPADAYAGHTPSIKIVGGDGQTGSPKEFGPQPLVVSVTDENGQPLSNVPVIFTVAKGTATVQAHHKSSAFTSLTLKTDSEGQAKIFFHLPVERNAPCEITCDVPGRMMTTPVAFHAKSDDGTGQYASPFAPTNFVSQGNADGSLDMSWTNNADDDEPVEIEFQQADGSWKLIDKLPPGTTSYHWTPKR